MITTQQAFDRIRDLSEQEIRELTRNRLLGEDVAPVENSYTDEPSEDLVIQLLKNGDLPEAIRKAVTAGLMDVFLDLQKNALLHRDNTTQRDWRTVAVRFCATLDVASPPELGSVANALLDLVLGHSGLKRAFLAPAVRATMGYSQTSDRIPAWEKILNDEPSVAAYAFNVLLTIDAQSPRIEQYLKTLWEKEILEDWPVDTAFLMRRAWRKRADDSIVVNVLQWLRGNRRAWDGVLSKLQRREWSRNWLKLLWMSIYTPGKQSLPSNRKAYTFRLPTIVMSPLPGSLERYIVYYNAEKHSEVANALEAIEDAVSIYRGAPASSFGQMECLEAETGSYQTTLVSTRR